MTIIGTIKKNIKILIIKHKNKKIYIGKNLVCSNLNMIQFGEYNHIEDSAKIYGYGKLILSDNIIIGPNLCALTSVHNYEDKYLPYGGNDLVGDIIIKENVWIGINVTILPGVTINEGAVIGAGSVVTKDVPKCAIVAGNPARVIKYRNMEHYRSLIRNKKFYLKSKWERL